MPRLIIFAPQFAPFANPEAYVSNKLVLAFLRQDWHINIVSRHYAAKVSYDYGSQWREPWKPLHDVTHEISYPAGSTLVKAIDALRCGISLGHVIDGCRWARRALNNAMYLHGENPYRLILSRSVPDSAHLPAMVMARTTDRPWIANWNDPPVMPPLHGKVGTSDISRRHKRFLAAAGREADWHTFPTERMMNYMLRFLGDDAKSKCSVIPHCVLGDPAGLPPPADKFSICYAGNIFADRYTEAFFEGFRRFVKEYALGRQAVLSIYGKVDDGFVKRIDEFGLAGTTEFVGQLPYAEIMKELARHAVLLILESPYAEGIFLPAKISDYVATGRPILAISPHPGTLHDLLTRDGGGIAANCLSADDILNALKALYSAWETGTLEASFGSGQLYNQFSEKSIISAYRVIFETLGIAENG